jgi:hypothetical protein
MTEGLNVSLSAKKRMKAGDFHEIRPEKWSEIRVLGK